MTTTVNIGEIKDDHYWRGIARACDGLLRLGQLPGGMRVEVNFLLALMREMRMEREEMEEVYRRMEHYIEVKEVA